MLWLAAFKRIFGDPVAIALGLLALSAGYFYGHLKGGIAESKVCEQKQDKAENEAYKEVKPIELKASGELSNIGKEYLNEKQANKVNADKQLGNLVGLRVKSTCASLPTGAGAGSGANAAGNTAAGNATSEVDFTDLTRQVEKLGLDYDNAVTKISKLQDTVNVYQSVCGIANP